MVNKQPEALRLADLMTHYWDERGPDAEEVAAELRRLHEVNADLLEALRVFVLCACPVSTEINERGHRWTEAYLDQALSIARAAIAKVKGQQ